VGIHGLLVRECWLRTAWRATLSDHAASDAQCVSPPRETARDVEGMYKSLHATVSGICRGDGRTAGKNNPRCVRARTVYQTGETVILFLAVAETPAVHRSVVCTHVPCRHTSLAEARPNDHHHSTWRMRECSAPDCPQIAGPVNLVTNSELRTGVPHIDDRAT
jgi:hypothetical protein